MNQATIINPPTTPDDFVSSIGETETESKRTLGERTSQVLSSIREGVSNAKVRCSEVYDGAREKVVAGAKTTDQAIRTHPYATMAIALSVGVIVGVLIGRRRSKDTTTTVA